VRRLIAVRHGQASAGSDDYDRLSERGHEQSRLLGAWLARQERLPRHVVVGRMRRHCETLAGIHDGLTRSLPEATELDDLDEFDHVAVIGGFCRRFADHPAAGIGPAPWQESPRRIAAMLHAAFSAWAGGELDREPGVEPWRDFRARVARGLLDTLNSAPDQESDVLLVSSGGVLTQLALQALDAPDHRAADLQMGFRNSALGEFLIDGDQLRLLGWNGLPHLAERPDLWTFY